MKQKKKKQEPLLHSTVYMDITVDEHPIGRILFDLYKDCR